MLWLNAGEGGPDRADQELQSMTELMGKLEAELERQLPYLSEAVKLITIVSDPIASVEQLYSALKETTPRETALFYHRSGQAIAVHTAARETSLISLKDKADVERRWTQLAEQTGRAGRLCPRGMGRLGCVAQGAAGRVKGLGCAALWPGLCCVRAGGARA
ncbi:hypothetical protein LJK88_27970 [Paenibacillus sp. P26]|nr:hypothetical protein LJK88_27970 [Paenibacillus sp. P26]